MMVWCRACKIGDPIPDGPVVPDGTEGAASIFWGNMARTVDLILNGSRFVAADVGAANGLPLEWQPLLDSACLYCVEPDAEAARKLADIYGTKPGITLRVLPVALSGTGGARRLHRTNVPTGSSLLPFDTEMARDYCDPSYFHPFTTVEVETRRLDDVLDEVEEHQLDLIKLDTQGTELEILLGLGQERLGRLLGIELEIGLPGAYRGQAQFHEVQATLVDAGFELFDFRLARTDLPRRGDDRFYRSQIFNVGPDDRSIASRLWETDALFIRHPAPLLADGDGAALRRLMVVYCTYRFFPEAYHLVSVAQSHGILDDEEAARTRSAIVSWHGHTARAITQGALPVTW